VGYTTYSWSDWVGLYLSRAWSHAGVRGRAGMPASLAFMCVRAGARSGGAARRRGATAVGCVCSTAARLPMAVVHVYVGITDRHAYHRIQRPTLRRFHPSHVSFGLLHRAVCAVEVLSETVGYLTTCTSGSRAHHTGTHLRITADMWVAVAGRSIECARNGGRAKSGAPWGGRRSGFQPSQRPQIFDSRIGTHTSGFSVARRVDCTPHTCLLDVRHAVCLP
jgi:hypothetical protein